jgi:tripartite ATP-independent transporter DctM subunit
MELGIIVVIATIVLVLVRVPVAIAFAAPSIVYLFYTGQPSLVLAQQLLHSLDSFTILAVPLFIYVGSLLNHGGITERIFDFADELIGHYRGGLAQVNTGTSLIFSGMSGAALADVGGLGRMLIHAMAENGYKRDYSAAVTSASATIGPIFPPSIPFIIYGIIGEVSIIDLFLAGIIPAIICTVSLALTTWILARHHDFPTGVNDTTPLEKLRLFFVALPALLTPVVLISGMLTGQFGPTEVAAVTVVYVVLINFIFYGNRTSQYLVTAGQEAVHTTSRILFILAGAAMFSYVISLEQLSEGVGTALFGLSENVFVLLLLINILLLIIGLFLETIAAILIATPILLPPMEALGVDPVHFGVIMVLNLMIGLLTPPLGLSIFVSSDIAEVPVEDVIKQMKPYYLPLLVTLLIVTYLPSLLLWIPNLI